MTKILFINPIGTSVFNEPMKKYLDTYKRPDTEVHVVSLPKDPHHLEYYSYDSLVIPDILRTV